MGDDGSRWIRPARWALLVITAATYLWNLSAAGYANSFYAAAVQAGTRSWKALLFGSLDAGNAITVDKPPAALWVMALSGRVFGFSSWSMLVPQALIGVATVALLTAAVGRWCGSALGLAAGALLAATPVAVLMFRFNNPDALLVLLMVAAGYATVRAVDSERGGTGWLALAGALVGLGFLAKMAEVLLVVPALALVYLVTARGSLAARLGRLATAGAAMVVSSGWYVLLVQLWPASARPYIGGSSTNSLWELAVGYNGVSRLVGRNRTPGAGRPATAGPAGLGVPGAHSFGGPGGHHFGGAAGIGRLFGASFAGNASWLLPSALFLLVVGLWLTRRTPRDDRTRAGLLLWGGWLLTSGIVFSFMGGMIHQYYVLALAPALAGTTALGAGLLWRRRAETSAQVAVSVAILGTAVWGWILLDRTPEFVPWLRWTVLAAGMAGASAPWVTRHRHLCARVFVAGAALVGMLGGSTAYAAQTELTAQHGGGVSAGPRAATTWPGGAHGGNERAIRTAGNEPSHRGAGFGGPGRDAAVDNGIAGLLRSAGTTWSAAAIGSQAAANLELATGTSVIGIGGFTGSDNAPTLAQFQHWVATGQVHYLVVEANGRSARGARRGGTAESITNWVTPRYPARTVGGSTVYDLTTPHVF
ncbi:MAG TPA: glycosyltransferase family 39 protein [Pseudonocardia sp.]